MSSMCFGPSTSSGSRSFFVSINLHRYHVDDRVCLESCERVTMIEAFLQSDDSVRRMIEALRDAANQMEMELHREIRIRAAIANQTSLADVPSAPLNDGLVRMRSGNGHE